MSIDKEFQRQVELAEWIQLHLTCSFNLDKTKRLALACFDLAIEHHAAICILHSSGLYGSLYALLRVEFEAYGRGLWLNHVATENDVTVFEKKDDPGISFGSLLSLVEEKVGLIQGPLSILKSNSWKIFCSFTHTGHQALLRRISEGQTGLGNYGETEVISAIKLAGTFALLSTIELAGLSQNSELVDMALSMAGEYARL